MCYNSSSLFQFPLKPSKDWAGHRFSSLQVEELSHTQSLSEAPTGSSPRGWGCELSPSPSLLGMCCRQRVCVHTSSWLLKWVCVPGFGSGLLFQKVNSFHSIQRNISKPMFRTTSLSNFISIKQDILIFICLISQLVLNSDREKMCYVPSR